MPHTCIHLHFDTTTMQHLTLALLSIHHPVNNRQRRALERDTLHKPSGTLIQRGTFKWKRAIKDMAGHVKQQWTAPTCTFVAHTDNIGSNTLLHFSCPMGHSRIAQQPMFSPAVPSKAVWCCTCKRAYGWKQWTCPCGTSWAACSIHFSGVPVGLVCKRKRTTPALQPATNEQSSAKIARIDSTHVSQSLHFPPGPLMLAKLASLRASDSSGSTAHGIT